MVPIFEDSKMYIQQISLESLNNIKIENGEKFEFLKQ